MPTHIKFHDDPSMSMMHDASLSMCMIVCMYPLLFSLGANFGDKRCCNTCGNGFSPCAVCAYSNLTITRGVLISYMETRLETIVLVIAS